MKEMDEKQTYFGSTHPHATIDVICVIHEDQTLLNGEYRQI
jgi:hypothetical protein